MRGVLLLAVLACACRPARPPIPPPPDGSVLLLTDEPTLLRPVETPMPSYFPRHGDADVQFPPDFAESFHLFEEGRKAYVARDYARAADAFIRAARALRVRNGPYADGALRNRQYLYRNAAAAWVMAGAADAGRETIKRLRASGAASVGDTQSALQVLTRR